VDQRGRLEGVLLPFSPQMMRGERAELFVQLPEQAVRP
jgi:hypothetical protein